MLAIALAIVALIFIGTRFGRAGSTETAMEVGDDAAAAAGRTATGPARASEGLFGRIGAMWDSAGRVRQLERENRDLQQWRELAERLAERNARYEELLRMPPDSFGQGSEIGNAIAAQLVLDSGGPFTRTLVANAGADHGVRVGYIAVNENGLVGRVVSVGRRSSRVLMLDDYNSRIPVMGEASRVRAVLAGQATQAPELLMGPFEVQSPRLDFIVGAPNLREGEQIMTSGDGGLFPRGLPVGLAHRGNDGQWRVTLAATRRAIDFVRLIPFVGAPPPEASTVVDAGPPLNTASAVSAIGRETMAPAPDRPSAAPPPAPAQTRARVQEAAATPAPTLSPAAPTVSPAPQEQAPQQTAATEQPPSALGPPPAQTEQPAREVEE